MASNLLEDLLLVGELRSALLGWFLWAPTALLVPALGWIGAPVAPRLAVGFGLSLCVWPTVSASSERFWSEAVRALALGVTVAVGAALVLWAALMAGGVADRLAPGGAARTGDPAAHVGLPTGPLSMLLGLLTILFFLGAGGPAQVGGALAHLATPPSAELVEPLIAGCIASVTLAVAVATPVLVAALVIDSVTAVVQRTAAPVVVEGWIGPFKALAFLFLLALSLGPMVAALGKELP